MLGDEPDSNTDEAHLDTKGTGGRRLQPEVAGTGVVAELGILGPKQRKVAPEKGGLDLKGGHLSLEPDGGSMKEAIRGLQLTHIFLQLKVELDQLLKGRGILRKRIC